MYLCIGTLCSKIMRRNAMKPANEKRTPNIRYVGSWHNLNMCRKCYDVPHHINIIYVCTQVFTYIRYDFYKFSAGKVLGLGQIDAAAKRSWCVCKTRRKNFDLPHWRNFNWGKHVKAYCIKLKISITKMRGLKWN